MSLFAKIRKREEELKSASQLREVKWKCSQALTTKGWKFSTSINTQVHTVWSIDDDDKYEKALQALSGFIDNHIEFRIKFTGNKNQYWITWYANLREAHCYAIKISSLDCLPHPKLFHALAIIMNTVVSINVHENNTLWEGRVIMTSMYAHEHGFNFLN